MTAEEYYRKLSDKKRVEKSEALELLQLYMRDLSLEGWGAEVCALGHGLGGRCFNDVKIIRLSEWWACYTTPAKLRETILHEIAHALCGAFGHGKVWEAKALELGVSKKHILGVRRAHEELLAGPTRKDKAAWKALSEEEKDRQRSSMV